MSKDQRIITAIAIVGIMLVAGLWVALRPDDEGINPPPPPPTNNPPTVTVLGPANGSTISTTTPLLVWNGSDPDGDELNYTVELAPAGGAMEVVTVTDNTSWQAAKLTPGESYRWQVTADDGQDRNISEQFTFSVDFTELALKIMAGLNLSQKVGQMIIGKVYRGSGTVDEVEGMLEAGELGGLLIGREEQTTDAEGILNFTNSLQAHAWNGTGIPLLMIADFEGGKMMNYASLMSQWPNPMTLGATNDSELAYDFGRYYGTEMAALGFNMAFAPVFDVNTNPDNPIIGLRSFGSDPDLVTRLGLEVLAGNREAGIISTVKHFPGHGDTSVDSHSGLPVLNFTRERLDAVELAPFAAAIEAGVPAIMSAHIAVPVLDNSSRPATLSSPILSGLLREELGFEGVIVTDSISMRAVRDNYGTLEAAKLAFEAGVDMLLYTGGNRTQLRGYHEYLMEELAAGNLTEERVNRSVFRILMMKLNYGLFDRYPASTANLTNLRAVEHVDATREIANGSVILFNNSDGLLPLNLTAEEPLLVISPDNLLMEDGNLSLAYYLAQRGYNVSQMVIDHTVTSLERDEVLERANESGLVILATHHFFWNPAYYGGTQVKLAEDLLNLSRNESIPVILLSVENPNDLRWLPAFNTTVVAANSKPMTLEAVAAAMNGEITFTGTMPVDPWA